MSSPSESPTRISSAGDWFLDHYQVIQDWFARYLQ